MYKNFIKVASANINTKLLNVEENKDSILKYMNYASNNNVEILLFPELTLTGVSSGELVATKEITDKCKKALDEIVENSKKSNMLVIFGMPIKINNKFYNAMLYVQNGQVINVTSKKTLSYEDKRYFSVAKDNSYFIDSNRDNSFYLRIFNSDKLNSYEGNFDFNLQLVFENELINNNYIVSENMNLILVPGSVKSTVNQINDIQNTLQIVSKTNGVGLIYAGASNGESSSDGIYASQKFILENGKIIAKGNSFTNGLIISEINSYECKNRETGMNYEAVYSPYEYKISETIFELTRQLDKYPYFPESKIFESSMRNILEIQSEALARRLKQIPEKKIFIGISGGLDSTLALIVASLAYYKLKLDSKDIHTITLPGLGTSNRTKNNAINLSKAYGTTFKEISIVESVKQHFKNIEHDENDTSVAYENAQARERTQVLMDLANKHGGIVLGTGNMSEIALGWATFNGDHMSMYNVNSGIPKTLLREVVRYVANNTENTLLKNTLIDIIETPISPELLPTNEEGTITQKTEDNVGPYELHDFFVYHLVRNKSKLSDILFMAKQAFSDKYSEEIIEKWFNKFRWRFVTQQFKKNIAVDGPQILDYSLNPKNGFIIPSDLDPNSFNI
ncbi:NAD(+) synthase [Helcococcus bovis]|uniref:Glutamine-dependent NAD(+) synthetase n=1 Tax=Helcococcus bovis TaxID=3153252 RepID=A0ABW9F888_9FIRM